MNLSDEELIAIGQDVFREESETINIIAKDLAQSFAKIVRCIAKCRGRIVLCGMGKSGHIARKISATFSSLGTPSFFLHPAEALHGDLGMVSEEDVVLLLSNSGETDEILHILPHLKIIGVTLIGLTGKDGSILAQECDIVQILQIRSEAGRLGLAPTVSTTAMLVYGDALALTLAEVNGFSSSDFGRYHPSGTLGRRVLLHVGDIMAVDNNVPLVKQDSSITDAILEMSHKGLGVVAVIDGDDELCGILTDGDLRRAIERRADLYGDTTEHIMTKKPKVLHEDLLVVDALKELKETRVNNFPVVDDKNRVIGMLTWQMVVHQGLVL